jgi:hypothetical protein
MLYEIYRQFNVRYTANMVPNTAHMLQFSLCDLWPQTYTMYLQLRIFRLQYSTERICAAIGAISTIQCSSYCKRGAKYSAHPPVYAVWTVVPDIYSVITAPSIQASIFNWTYLRCYSRYIDNSMWVMLQPWCQMLRTSSSWRYLYGGPGHIKWIYSSTYSGFNIQLTVSALPLEIYRQYNVRYTVYMVPNTAHIRQFTLSVLWSRTYTMY